jgi:methoxymalonate biosynthesis acyl carrier protein
MPMTELRDKVRQFILSNHLPGESPENLRDDMPLQSSGILDSLAALELVAFLQRECGIELDVYDTAVERFDSIDDMVQCIERKSGSQTRAAG